MINEISEYSANEITAAKLLGSLLLFTQTFYKIRTGREFQLSQPISRESHYITICRALTRVQRGLCKRLIINVPPRYGKTELSIHFIAWCLAQYPDSKFMYVSYAHTLAAKQTNTIRHIITNPEFKALFGVELSTDTAAKDNFETLQGGAVYAAGEGGTITGQGAGIRGCHERFSGAIFIDDILKPDEATSDTVRERRNEWYFNTLRSRKNNDDTPIIYIGQRLHEDDLAGKLLSGFDGEEWETVILPALDSSNNALLPTMHSTESLLKLKETSPYVFSAQYQQNPQPAGGGIFRGEWLHWLEEDPDIITTFIVTDTAETDKSWNDATVFSFFGVYKIDGTNEYGLHWLDCWEIRVEPFRLEEQFMQFYASCNLYKKPPRYAFIEKKSTGTTLCSVLKNKLRGITVMEVDRTSASGSKTARFLRIQPYLSSKLVSYMRGAKHIDMCIKHLEKITANNSHAHDDIADTLADAIEKALIEKVVYFDVNNNGAYNQQFKKQYGSYKPVVF